MNKIGVNPYHSILFNTLIKEVFNNLLYILYFGTEHLEHLTPEDWLNIKRLSTDWHFPRVKLPLFECLSHFEEDLFLHLLKSWQTLYQSIGYLMNRNGYQGEYMVVLS
jgi:hypothetical protein